MKPGRPALLSASEVLTLAILAQWPRFRSERDFWRFACSHLRTYFPNLCSQSQLTTAVSAPLRPDLSGHRASEGAPQGIVLRASYLRKVPLENRVGLRVQGSARVDPQDVV
jgi:hypothetical protein